MWRTRLLSISLRYVSQWAEATTAKAEPTPNIANSNI
jgi:hypothetical protein